MTNFHRVSKETFLSRTTLMFHEIIDSPFAGSGFVTNAKSKYYINSKQFISYVQQYGDSVNYSFDDGGRSNLIAARILNERGLYGIFFVCSAYIDKEGFLTASEIKELAKKNLVFSHGHNHLMTETDYKLLYDEWEIALEQIDRLGLRTDVVCLPGGTFSPQHYRVLLDLGVRYVFHSSNSSKLFQAMYGHNLIFLPREVILRKNIEMRLRLAPLKSYLKALIYRYK